MSTRAQIDIAKGNTTVRIFVGHDGYPDNVESLLSEAMGAGHTEPLNIAYAIVQSNPDWKLSIVAKDHDPAWELDYHYSVNVSKTQWRVKLMPRVKLVPTRKLTASARRKRRATVK